MELSLRLELESLEKELLLAKKEAEEAKEQNDFLRAEVERTKDETSEYESYMQKKTMREQVKVRARACVCVCVSACVCVSVAACLQEVIQQSISRPPFLPLAPPLSLFSRQVQNLGDENQQSLDHIAAEKQRKAKEFDDIKKSELPLLPAP